MKGSWKRLVKCMVCSLFLCLMAAAVVPGSRVSAASYQKVTEQKQKIGKYYFWLESGRLYYGKTKNSSSEKISLYCSSAVTNGAIIYYGEYYNGGVQLYRYSIKEKRYRLLAFLEGMQEIVAVQGRKIFLNGTGQEIMPYHLYSYHMDTWKTKKVVSNMEARDAYKQYIVGTPQSGGIGELPLYVYNTKTGKRKTIEKKMLTYIVDRKNVYYAKVVSGTYGSWKVKAYRYNLTTGKKKALSSKTIKCTGILGISSKAMTYYNMKDKQCQLKF